MDNFNTYNYIFKLNPYAGKLLKFLDIYHASLNPTGKYHLERFRDIHYIEEKTRYEKQETMLTRNIVVTTRMGPKNKEYYPDLTEKIKEHPSFLYCSDDLYDNTYMYFRFFLKRSTDEFKMFRDILNKQTDPREFSLKFPEYLENFSVKELEKLTKISEKEKDFLGIQLSDDD